MCISFLRKLKTFKTLQKTYMLGVEAIWDEAEDEHDPDEPPPKAEDIKLWMPSELEAPQRRTACRKGVAEIKAKVRHGQCEDALANLRSRLHAQRHLIT
jgi:hypothetical protein